MIGKAGERPAATKSHALAQCSEVGAARLAHHHGLLAHGHRWWGGSAGGSPWRGGRWWCRGRTARGSRSAHGAHRALAAWRQARQVGLQALQGGGAPGRHARAMRLIVGAAGLADRVGLCLRRLLCRRREATGNQCHGCQWQITADSMLHRGLAPCEGRTLPITACGNKHGP